MFKNVLRFNAFNNEELITDMKDVFFRVKNKLMDNNILGNDNDESVLRLLADDIFDELIIIHPEFKDLAGDGLEIRNICLFSAVCHYLCNTNRLKGMSRRDFIFSFGLGKYREKYSTKETLLKIAKQDGTDDIDYGIADFEMENKLFYNHFQKIKEKRTDLIYVDDWTGDISHKMSKENRNDSGSFEYNHTIAQPLFSEAFIVHSLNCVAQNIKAPVGENYYLPETFKVDENMRSAANAYLTIYKRLNSYYRKLNNFESVKDSINTPKGRKFKIDELIAFYQYICKSVNDERFSEYAGVGLFRAESNYWITSYIDVTKQLAPIKIKNRDEKFNKALSLAPLIPIPFRRIRDKIIALNDFLETILASDSFTDFITKFEALCASLIDEFIEQKFFGDKCHEIFAKITKSLYKEVLYNNEEIVLPNNYRLSQNDFKIVVTSRDEFANYFSGGSLIDEECAKYLNDLILSAENDICNNEPEFQNNLLEMMLRCYV